MTTEERLAVVETEQKDTNRIIREIRDDLKAHIKNDKVQDLKIASLEQSRATARKVSGILSVPILGTVLYTVGKGLGIY